MDQNCTGSFTEEQMEEHIEKLYKYKTRLKNFISSFTPEQFRIMESRLEEEKKSIDKINTQTKEFLGKKFQHNICLNMNGRIVSYWQTKYKFMIIFNPCNSSVKDRHWRFEYNDSLVYYKTKDMGFTGAFLDPEWIPNLIEQLDKDPKKLETKPEVIIWLENKYDMKSELWPDLFGQWVVRKKGSNHCPYYSNNRDAFIIQFFSNNPFNTPAVTIDQQGNWSSGSSKFYALYWHGYPIHRYEQSKEDIDNFVNKIKEAENNVQTNKLIN